MDRVFIAHGSGYADDTTFDPYEVLREPLPERESRVLNHEGRRVCYRAYSLKLAQRRDFPGGFHYLLITHGGGSYVMELHVPDELVQTILTLPDPQAYAVLHAIFQSADHADRHARQATAAEYGRAFLDGRLKKSRKKQGHQRVYIDPPAAPTSIAC